MDSKNLAIAICFLFIYGLTTPLSLLVLCSYTMFPGIFDDDELCWLVIWEAGIIIQLPAGVLFGYPSAIFYHFNINLCGE